VISAAMKAVIYLGTKQKFRVNASFRPVLFDHRKITFLKRVQGRARSKADSQALAEAQHQVRTDEHEQPLVPLQTQGPDEVEVESWSIGWATIGFFAGSLTLIVVTAIRLHFARPVAGVDVGIILNTYREMHWESGFVSGSDMAVLFAGYDCMGVPGGKWGIGA
jgi:hypothetical protein